MPAKSKSRKRGRGPSPENWAPARSPPPQTSPPPLPSLSLPSVSLPLRRSRRQPAVRARPQPAADALILLTVGDIPRRDRHELQCILDQFHANQALQDECREILRNEAEFLVPEHTKEQGCGFVAKTDIPAGKRLTLYAGRLSKFNGSPGTHYMCMGDIGLGYPLVIDGTPRAQAAPAQASVGQMQMLNHACPPHANTRSASLVCDVTGISVFYVESTRPIPKGTAVRFSYQTTVTQTSFWRLEGTLGPLPRGCELRKCLCAAPQPCPNRYARHEKKAQHVPVPPLPALPAPPPHTPPPTPQHLYPPHQPPPSSPPASPPARPAAIHSSPPPHSPAPSPPPRLSSLPPPSASAPPQVSRAPPPDSHTHILTLNVGPHGLRAALPNLLADLESRPAVVLLQECHLPVTSLAEVRRMVHKLLPAYTVFANRRQASARKARQIHVVTLVHVHLAARATMLDINQQLAAIDLVAPDCRWRVHFLRVLDPHSQVALLIGNVYQAQATQPEQQDALLALTGSVIQRWSDQSDHIIIGGDWNASLQQRVGYSGLAHINRADARLRSWSMQAGLTCEAPADYTWASANESRRSVLDCFFWKSRSGKPSICSVEAFQSSDPTLDHAGVRARLNEEGIGEMPSLEALRRPVRIKLDKWSEKREQWQRAVERDLTMAAPGAAAQDVLQALDMAKQAALSCARRILGVTGGKIRSAIPNHSGEYIRLQTRLRLLRVVRRELYTRQQQGATAPSKAMRRAYDSGLCPQPAPVAALGDVWGPAHREWTETWLRLLRRLSHEATEALTELRCTAVAAAERQSQQAAIARFWTGGEIRRLLRPQIPGLHSPLLRCDAPDTLQVAGSAASLDRFVDGLHVGRVSRSANLVTVTGLSPTTLHTALSRLTGTDVIVQAVGGGGHMVTRVGDRLGAWEYSLATAAAAQKQQCRECLDKRLLPISVEQDGARSICTWCLNCKRAVEVVVDSQAYDDLAFVLSRAEIPRVPPHAEETLRGAVMIEDYDFLMTQLPNRKAPGPDEIPYEMWKSAPDSLRRALIDCINAILEGETAPPESWLGGRVRFLFKHKGELTEPRNYRPVCLQDTAYKILTAILTDRLYRLAERYGLQDPSQEGFRRLHSPQRQAQSLHWAFEAAAERQGQIYVIYIDFENAFNSVDHEALWRWLRELNIPDVDLLQALYKRAYYEADLPYGRSAPIYLTRGTKQGDKLSPLLFGLIFNALLLALKTTGVGHRTITGLRTPARGFADDLGIVCSSAADMQRLMGVVARFCDWSGMRVNLGKTVITAFDYRTKTDLDTDQIRFNGNPLIRLAADESFPYLGVRASLIASRKRCALSPGLASEKDHVFSATRELVHIAKDHRYLLGQMVPTMHMVASSRFRYAAPLVPWTDSELDKLHKMWLQVHKASWHLTPGYPAGPLSLPSERGGCPVAHPVVAMIQALSKHIEQLVALPDDIRHDTVARFKRLCANCGCHNARELTVHLAAEKTPRRCPIARLLRACGQLKLEIRLPACLSIGKAERETSWHALLSHLRRRASQPEASEQTRSDVECLASAWGAVRRRLARRGIKQPRQLVLDPHAPSVVWLVPSTLPRRPHWLEPLRRALTLADAAALFPRLPRGEGTRNAPAHQTLVSDTIRALRHPQCDTPRLFMDERWQLVRSTAPVSVWRNLLQRHGLVSSFDHDNWQERQTGPILDMLALGHSPDVTADCLRELCIGLAPYLRTTTSADVDADMRDDENPLTWAPVRLSTERVAFQFTDETAKTEIHGPYQVEIKDGLTRVTQADRHVATLAQGRWAMLVAGYDPQDLCAALPGWAAQAEKEESSRGVASQQFWHGIRAVLEADGIVGCNPLLAPSSFPVAVRCWGLVEGWGHSAPHPTRVMHCLLTLSPEEQRKLCLGLKSSAVWWALTRSSTLDPEVRTALARRGNVVAVFKRGVRAAMAKGAWRQAKLKTVKTRESWTLWASSGAADSAQTRADLKARLESIALTEDGVVPLDMADPLAREALLGPAGAAYRNQGIVVGSDGSLRRDGAMGAAYASRNSEMPARSVAVYGSPSSARPEMTAINMACQDCPTDTDLTVLTDSLSCMQMLKSLQRRDFPLWLYRHPIRQLLKQTVRAINARAAAGAVTRLIKVKSHRGELLNEAADSMAATAAELDPCRPLDLDPEAVYFYHKGAPVEWDSQLRDHLVQVAADVNLQRIGREQRRRDGSVAPAHIPLSTAWLLRPDQGRSTLGGVLGSMKITPRKRRILQSIAGTYPSNAVLFKWKRTNSPACLLCGGASETLAHIQCRCPALKEARIRAHHTLAAMLWGRLTNLSKEWQIHREVSVAAMSSIDAPLHYRDTWQRACDDITDQDLEGSDDADTSAELLRKRPDALALRWKTKTVAILEFTRGYDWRPNWHTETDQYKTARYLPLRDKLQRCLGDAWSVEVVPFTIGVRGSYEETAWAARLARFGLTGTQVTALMTDLVTNCLTEHDAILLTRIAAIRNINANE